MRLPGSLYINMCIEHDFFSSGTNEQYDTVINMFTSGRNLHDIAVCTWICSNESIRKKYSINKIETMLKSLLR